MRVRSSSARGAWGTAFAHLLARARPRRRSLPRRDSARDRETAATAYVEADLVVVAVRRGRAFREVLAVPSRRSRRRRRAGELRSRLTKGLDPATGERLSTLVRDRPVAVLSGPNMAEEVAAGLPGATVIASRGRAARAPAAGGDQLARLPRLRERRRRRRRALRRGEERDRARGGRRRRARARRQREGGADHARARRDGAARRGLRRGAGDVLRPRRHGRPDGHAASTRAAATAARAS